MLSLIAGLLLAPQAKFDFFENGPYAPEVPRPESVLGYSAGDRLTTFRDQERVLNAIASAAPDRVKVITYGKSVEGRPLRVLAISSPANMRRLDAIRLDNERIASGTATNRDALIKRTPAIVWINESIHGNEPASFESGMWLIYNLAASRGSLAKTLENTVVFVNPVFNPDGRERYTVWYGSIATGTAEPGAFERSEPSVVHGRTNHYRFDMNRDHVALSQDETRQEVAELLRWNPQVYVDQHGQVGTYFFPPNPMSINANVDRNRLNKWTDVFGRATAAAFDRQGWLYYVKDAFDFFAPVYTDTWAGLSGAIGMTHETEGSKTLRLEREDGSVWTMRDSIAKHFTSALAVIGASSANKDALVTSFADFKARAASGQAAGSFKRVIVQGDPRELARLAEQLARSGINSAFAAQPFSQPKASSYWSDETQTLLAPAGSLVVDMAQPQGALAKSLFEPQVDFEPEFTKAQIERRKKMLSDETYPEPEGFEFYDITGWALPYLHNLRAWWSDSTPAFQSGAVKMPEPAELGAPAIGWALAYSDRADILAVADLLSKGVRVMVGPREMKVGGKTYPRGSFIVLRGRNEPNVSERLRSVQQTWKVRFEPIETAYPDEGRIGPGSGEVASLKKPKIGVVFGDRAWTSAYGSLWYLMDREFKIPFTPLTAGALNGDLSKYTAIVLPSGQYGPPSDNLKAWVRSGGSLVLLSAGQWALGERGFVTLETVKFEKDKDPASLPGSLFRAQLDPRSFLSMGYAARGEDPIEIAVPVEGGSFAKAVKTGGGAVKLGDEKTKKLLSGWQWPDETEKVLSGTVWLHDQQFGSGHVIIFMQDPTDRAMYPGLYKLLLNAMLLAPSF